jgi:hypothetical protein
MLKHMILRIQRSGLLAKSLRRLKVTYSKCEEPCSVRREMPFFGCKRRDVSEQFTRPVWRRDVIKDSCERSACARGATEESFTLNEYRLNYSA